MVSSVWILCIEMHWNDSAVYKLYRNLHRNLGNLKIFIHTSLSDFVCLFWLELTTFTSALKPNQKFLCK